MISFKQFLSEQESMPATIMVKGKERPTKNSLGKPIALSIKSIENFWKWFGDSKVVDSLGRPLVCYHGTGSDFGTFDKKMAHDKQGRQFGVGTGKGVFSFARDVRDANNYALNTSKRGEYGVSSSNINVMPVYLKIVNPIDRDEFRDLLSDKLKGYAFVIPKVRDAKIAEVYKEIKSKKFDGIIAGFGEYTAFDPKQIKSAIGNNGNFSKTSNNITEETI